MGRTRSCRLGGLRRPSSGSEAEHRLHTHVNTIRNRLARFEELTGRDLRRSADLVETWWALQRSAAG
jgi:DNA-binding PucR family transcriptional regulator